MDPLDLQPLDPLLWLRERPQQFFMNGPEPYTLIASMVADALELVNGSCIVHHCADWWIVGSEVDWLVHPTLSDRELFERVVAEPERGRHSMRSEILVSAYASSVWLALDGVLTRVHGSHTPNEEARSAATAVRRAVLFSMCA